MTNRVLLYLLGRENEPSVMKVLQQYYEHALHFSKQWIESGQQHGVIKSFIDSSRTAELWILLMLGYQVHHAIPGKKPSFQTEELKLLMSNLLKA
ncbi:hypothetical protein [Bacillus rhizoplanae]|uniref:hypothetical protein n=1 Tax=Bacillus rhizoplanae TaxID=2880966 RepID=UPI003D210164